jgi:hypothetical protein
MKHILALLMLVAAGAYAAADDVRSRPLMLHSPALVARALKYGLLPDLMDTTPGNAADHYRRATQNLREEAPPGLEPFEAYGQWLKPPLKDLPLDDMARFLKRCESTLREVDAGARCEQCDWGLTAELRQKGIGALGADLLAIRSIGRLLALRCRYELAQGRTQDAMQTLRSGFALARHVADAPWLLFAFYGMEISSRMLDVLEEFIQAADAPSLYWPLTDLPRPLFDMRKQLQGEREAVYGTFPGAAEMAGDLPAKPWTPGQIANLMFIWGYVEDNDDRTRIGKAADEVKMLLRVAAQHEAAKKVLLDEGRPKELVDAMPHLQVALLVSLRHWDHVFDESFKCQSLPYPELMTALDRAEVRQREVMDDPNSPAMPIARLLPVRVRQIFAVRAQIDRRVAALRCVEAVRLYAAAHDGKLPASLDEIKDTPIPLDPVDGKPFGYRVVGDHAFFSSSPFPGQPANNGNTPTYELIFSR